MSIPGLGGSSGLSSSAATAEEASVEKEGFLKLLVAQLGNQDPMSPQDSDKYVDQLTSFSMLEQMMNLNKGVNNLSVGQLSNNTQDAVRFVGREVIARGDSINFDGTTAAPVKYHMPYGVVTSTVSVYDQNGNLVHQEEANPAPGASQFEWDGRDSEGRVVPPANIEAVEAYDESENPVPVDTFVRGQVESVRFDNGFPELLVGGRRLKMSDITEVQ